MATTSTAHALFTFTTCPATATTKATCAANATAAKISGKKAKLMRENYKS